MVAGFDPAYRRLNFWISFACAALCASLPITLRPSIWLWLSLASGIGTFGGLWLGFMIWPTDPLGSGLTPFFVATITLVMITVGISSGIIMRPRSISNEKPRRAVWAAILACVAFGPVVLVLSPAVIQSRIIRNNRLAAERFAALRQAVESTYAEPDGPRKICDSTELRRRYSGPSFGDLDWRRITSNFVKQDGYFFMIFCHETRGYGCRKSRQRPGRRYAPILHRRVGQSRLPCGVEPFPL